MSFRRLLFQTLQRLPRDQYADFPSAEGHEEVEDALSEILHILGDPYDTPIQTSNPRNYSPTRAVRSLLWINARDQRKYKTAPHKWGLKNSIHKPHLWEAGYAWGTNVGWINFNPTDGGVTVDAETGSFSGYAWGENIGWIHFANTSPTAYHVEFVTNTLTIEAATPKSYAVGCGETLVRVNVTDTGSCLTGITINRIAGNAPNAPAGIQDGQHWQITPTGCTTGFTVSLTLPHTNGITAANARACRYDSGTSSWDCDEAAANTSSDGSVVTRTDVTEFSIWAVGNASQPLAVTLANFSAEAQERVVYVNWETVSEVENLGFNLYRATDINGEQIKLNNELIPGQAPGSGQGSAYEFVDQEIEAGQSYFYWLEDLDVNGNRTTHGPISATANVPTAVTVGSLDSKLPNQASWLLGMMLLTLLAATIWHKRRRA